MKVNCTVNFEIIEKNERAQTQQHTHSEWPDTSTGHSYDTYDIKKESLMLNMLRCYFY